MNGHMNVKNIYVYGYKHTQRLLRHVAFDKMGLSHMSSICNYPIPAIFTSPFVFQMAFHTSKTEPLVCAFWEKKNDHGQKSHLSTRI